MASQKKKTRRKNTTKNRLDIWQYQNTISRRLLYWATLNIVGGMWLQQQKSKVWRGVGMQAMGWGMVNAGIAVIGTLASRWRKNQQDNPNKASVTTKEHRNLFRALWINGILDIFYILGGLIMMQTRGKEDRLMRGNGLGIIIQGLFLAVFDAVHAYILQPPDEPKA